MGIEPIEISKLTGKLQTLATAVDDDGNGKIEGKEIEFFQNTAKAAGLEDTDGYKAIFGSEIKTKAPVTAPVTLTKKETNKYQDSVKDFTKDLVKGKVKPEDLMEALKKQFANTEYKPMLDEVEYVLNLVNGTKYSSKEDIEKIHDTVKKQLKTDKKWDSFHKDILGYLEDQAKETQIQRETDALTARYTKIKGSTTNFKESVEKLKKELKDKKEWNKSYTQEAFKRVEQLAKEEALDVVDDHLENRYKGVLDGTVRDADTKEYLEAQNANDDKYVDKAIGKRKKERKTIDRGAKVNHRAVEISSLTRNDIKKELGDDLFEKLNRSYLPTVLKEDGSYDLSDISDAIVSRAGADFVVNQSKDDKMAEITNIKNHLQAEFGVELTDKEVKKLIKFCEIKRERNDHTPGILKTLIGGASGLIGAMGANSTLDVTQKVTITIEEAATAEALKTELREQGIKFSETELTNGKVSIKILQEVFSDKTVLNLLKGLGIGLITGAAFDLVFGNKRDEQSCMSIADYDIHDPKYTNADKYKEYVAQVFSKSPEKVAALHVLVDAYHEKYGENWHSEFQQVLRDVAGIGSKLNPNECRMLKYQDVKVKGNDDDGDDGDNEIHNTEDDHTYATHQKDAVEAEYEAVPVIDGSTTSWPKIAGQYDCLIQTYGLQDAIRMIKIAQAIKNGDYSKENMEKLLQLSKKGHDNLRNIEGVNFNAYMSAIRATYLPALKKDSNGKPIEGTGVKVPVELAECTRDTSKSLKADKAKDAETVIAPTGNAPDRIKTKDGQAAEYYARFDNGTTQRYTSMADRDRAVEDFKKKYPNAKVDKWDNEN